MTSMNEISLDINNQLRAINSNYAHRKKNKVNRYDFETSTKNRLELRERKVLKRIFESIKERDPSTRRKLFSFWKSLI